MVPNVGASDTSRKFSGDNVFLITSAVNNGLGACRFSDLDADITSPTYGSLSKPFQPQFPRKYPRKSFNLHDIPVFNDELYRSIRFLTRVCYLGDLKQNVIPLAGQFSILQLRSLKVGCYSLTGQLPHCSMICETG